MNTKYTKNGTMTFADIYIDLHDYIFRLHTESFLGGNSTKKKLQLILIESCVIN